MTSMQRVLAALGHQEPDRVPVFLLVSMHGAKELGLSIREYFSRPEHVVEGQLRMRAKFGHDCLYAFFYAPVEVEAWGGEVVFRDDGPPNSGAPMLRDAADIPALTSPDPSRTPCLVKVLDAIAGLAAKAAGEVPVIGVVMSPFSLPVMQMGFERYLDLIYERPALLAALLRVNEEFCVSWANAQLKAGATAICYFDPVSSPTIVPRELYLRTGHEVARRTLARIQGPTATHLASGRSLEILGDLASTGTAIAGVSAIEDLAELKEAARRKIALLGNLNGIEMRRWTPVEAAARAKDAIGRAGAGGGFILADNHGEIPYQVPEEVLVGIMDGARTWGAYPLTWTEAGG